MSNRNFIIVIVVVGLALGALFVKTKKAEPVLARLGTKQSDEGRQHVAQTEKIQYKATIPTSGPHSQEASWGVSPVQKPNESVVHNMEHGGIVISYKPDLDPDTVSKLTALFEKPYSVSTFLPTKAIVMPRSEQSKPIVLASWNRGLQLDNFDQQKIIDYYNTNIGKSPEPKGR